MDPRQPGNRRLERSSRITVAVVLLVVASAAVLAAVWIADRWFLVGACVLAVGCGWTALRLTWTVVLKTRLDSATDRTELARTYRELFTTRSVEHHGFVSGMSQRLAARDHQVRQLEGSLSVVEMRAIEAETSVRRFQLRLDDAESRLFSLEDLLTAAGFAPDQDQPVTAAPAAAQAGNKPQVPAQPGVSDSADDSVVVSGETDAETTMPLVLPDWASLETDPTAALLAWEQHAAAASEPAKAGGGSRAESA